MINKVKALVVAGVMSGTSADGVDVAVARIAPGKAGGGAARIKLLGHEGFAYPKALRAQVARAMEGEPLSAGEFSRLNWKLGELYADCVAKAVEGLGAKVALVGCTGRRCSTRLERLRGRWAKRRCCASAWVCPW